MAEMDAERAEVRRLRVELGSQSEAKIALEGALERTRAVNAEQVCGLESAVDRVSRNGNGA